MTNKESDFMKMGGAVSIKISKFVVPDFPKAGEWKPWKKKLVHALECAMQWRSGELPPKIVNAVFNVETIMDHCVRRLSLVDPEEKAFLKALSKLLANVLKNIDGIPKNIQLNMRKFEDDIVYHTDPEK